MDKKRKFKIDRGGISFAFVMNGRMCNNKAGKIIIRKMSAGIREERMTALIFKA